MIFYIFEILLYDFFNFQFSKNILRFFSQKNYFIKSTFRNSKKSYISLHDVGNKF
jgi:hypothetical protein